MIDVIRVAQKTNVNNLAGSIALALKEQDQVEVRAIGAIAVNQSVKGIATARGHLASTGYDLNVIPAYVDVEENGRIKTGISLRVTKTKK